MDVAVKIPLPSCLESEILRYFIPTSEFRLWRPYFIQDLPDTYQSRRVVRVARPSNMDIDVGILY